MNNEIKEILDDLKFTNNDAMWCDKITLDAEQSHLLLDYITNLRQEKDTYKEQLRITHKDLEHYISLCEKAIAYIKDYRTEGYIFVSKNNLLNILQNGSDDNEYS